jgi:multiple sugar transport system substrate-binding protein
MQRLAIQAKVLCLLLIITFVIGGCGAAGNPNGDNGASAGANNMTDSDTQSKTDAASKKADPQPVKLSIFFRSNLTDSLMQQFIIEPVQKKYPYITLDFVRQGKGLTAGDLVTAGNFPDLIYASTPWFGEFKDLNLLYDMRELIKQNKYELSQLNQPALDGIQMWGDQGQLYALPYFLNFSALFYNKDIFDKFGVPYPKDGMTWDDAVDLAHKVTRMDGGIAYKGLDPAPINDTASQLSIPYVDPKTDAALPKPDLLKPVLNLFANAYSIPGNEQGKKARDIFIKDRALAMYPDWGINMFDALAETEKGQPMNWDMVSLPTFKEAQGMSRAVDAHYIGISSVSKNKDAAFQVISYLTSKEVQMELSKNGKMSSLNDPQIRSSFGQDLEILKGKNVKSAFLLKPAPRPEFTIYDDLINKVVGKALSEVTDNHKDINSALREAQESGNKAIQDAKGK